MPISVYGKIDSVDLRLILCPAVPLNVSTASCPGTVVVTETGTPSAAMVAVTSGGTLNSVNV